MGMAERIKEKRIELGLTQEELGEKLGLQKSAIAKYENGRVENIKRSVIADMAKIFNCSPTYLMDFDEPTEVASSNKANAEQPNVIDNNNNLHYLDHAFLSLAKEAQESGLDKDDIDAIIETIKTVKRNREERESKRSNK